MPSSPPHLCSRCRSIVTGRCPTCSSGWTQRPTTRQTPTSHRRWRTLRDQVLQDEPTCRVCDFLPSVTVDHIVPIAEGGAELDRDNLQGICTPCHDAKTAEEAARGRARRAQG